MGFTVSDLGRKAEKEKTPFCQRLDQAITSAGGVTKLVRTLKNQIPLSSLNRYLDGDTDIPSQRLGLIAEATGVSLDWLILGRGSSEFGDTASFPPKSETIDIVPIPLLSVTAGAGAGVINHSLEVLDRLPFSRALLRQLGAPPDRVAFIRAAGDSMSPTIRDGGLVLVDQSNCEVVDGKIYVVSLGDELRIKRVVRSIDGRITLKSDGDERLFPPESLGAADAEQLQVHGRVFWTERLL